MEKFTTLEEKELVAISSTPSSSSRRRWRDQASVKVDALTLSGGGAMSDYDKQLLEKLQMAHVDSEGHGNSRILPTCTAPTPSHVSPPLRAQWLSAISTIL